MKPNVVLMIAASLLASALMGVGLILAASAPDLALGRYPGAAEESLSLRLQDGDLLAQNSVFQTSDSWDKVVAWYATQYRVGPYREIYLQDHCARLAQVNTFLVSRQTVSVSICGLPGRTRIGLKQTISFNP